VAHAFLALQRARYRRGNHPVLRTMSRSNSANATERRYRRGNHPVLRTLGAVMRFLQCTLGDCPTCGRKVSASSAPGQEAIPDRY
jgi:hypothetical protein